MTPPIPHDLHLTRYELTAEELLIILFVLERTLFRGLPAVRIETQREVADLIAMDEGNLSRNLRALRTAHVLGTDPAGCWYLHPSSTWRLRPRLHWTTEHQTALDTIEARPLDDATWFPEPPGLERALAETILPVAQPAAGDRPPARTAPDFAALRHLVQETTPAPRLDRAGRSCALVQKTNRAEQCENIAPNAPALVPAAPPVHSPARAIDRDRTILLDQQAGTDRIDRSKTAAEAYIAEKLSHPSMRQVAIEVTGGLRHMTDAFRQLLQRQPDRLQQLIGECLHRDIRNKPAWLNVAMRKALEEKKP